MPLVLDGDVQLINEFDGDPELTYVNDGDLDLIITNDGEAGIFTAVSGDYGFYTGAYEVIPKVNSQTLGTENKILTQDVTVTGVPYYETSNPSGGKTIYIASELGGQ